MIDEENEEVSPLQLSEDEAVAIERTLDDLDLALDGNGSAVEQVKRWQTLLENLTAKDHVCTVDALMGDEPMWLPAIDKDWPYKQQVDVLRALLLMDNARKLASGGYRDGMLFLPWTKPGSEGHREVRTVVRSVAGEYSEQLFKVGAVGTALATISCAHKHKKDGSWSCGSPNAEVRELLVRSLTGDTFPRLRGLVSSPRYALLDDGSLYLANREGYDPRTLF